MKAHQSCARRAKYRLVSGGETLTWERPMANDSRVEQITCSAEWFYSQMLPDRSTHTHTKEHDVTTTIEHNLHTSPAPTRDGIAPDTTAIHVSEGADWATSTHLGWSREVPTLPGCRYEPIPSESAGRSWATVVVGQFVAEETDDTVAWAWRYYR